MSVENFSNSLIKMDNARVLALTGKCVKLATMPKPNSISFSSTPAAKRDRLLNRGALSSRAILARIVVIAK